MVISFTSMTAYFLFQEECSPIAFHSQTQPKSCALRSLNSPQTFLLLKPHLTTYQDCCFIIHLGSASERATGQEAVWARSAHVAQYCCDVSLVRLGVGKGERANTSDGSEATCYHMLPALSCENWLGAIAALLRRPRLSRPRLEAVSSVPSRQMPP